jgi:hypothetical protein
MDEDLVRVEIDAAASRLISAYFDLPRHRRPSFDYRLDELLGEALSLRCTDLAVGFVRDRGAEWLRDLERAASRTSAAAVR